MKRNPLHAEYRRMYRQLHYLANKKKHNQLAKLYYYKHAKRLAPLRRDWHLRTNYGITLADEKKLLKKQKGKCAICKTVKFGRHRSIDHDHNTGQIRGILCGRCNSGIGMFREDVTLLTEAVKYLRRNHGGH
jgi:hypothetical protein